MGKEKTSSSEKPSIQDLGNWVRLSISWVLAIITLHTYTWRPFSDPHTHTHTHDILMMELKSYVRWLIFRGYLRRSWQEKNIVYSAWHCGNNSRLCLMKSVLKWEHSISTDNQISHLYRTARPGHIQIKCKRIQYQRSSLLACRRERNFCCTHLRIIKRYNSGHFRHHYHLWDLLHSACPAWLLA